MSGVEMMTETVRRRIWREFGQHRTVQRMAMEDEHQRQKRLVDEIMANPMLRPYLEVVENAIQKMRAR